jgi:hypothetical protein
MADTESWALCDEYSAGVGGRPDCTPEVGHVGGTFGLSAEQVKGVPFSGCRDYRRMLGQRIDDSEMRVVGHNLAPRVLGRASVVTLVSGVLPFYGNRAHSQVGWPNNVGIVEIESQAVLSPLVPAMTTFTE